jgi:hypothetical protein
MSDSKEWPNNEQRLITTQWDKEQSALRAVTAGFSIVRCHYCLMGNRLNYGTPLVIQRTGGSVPLYITDDGIEQMLCSLAQHTKPAWSSQGCSCHQVLVQPLSSHRRLCHPSQHGSHHHTDPAPSVLELYRLLDIPSQY